MAALKKAESERVKSLGKPSKARQPI